MSAASGFSKVCIATKEDPVRNNTEWFNVKTLLGTGRVDQTLTWPIGGTADTEVLGASGETRPGAHPG